ncbi:MAG: GDSL-type esterase/lipase family protein [Planctomycetota bacterium]|nr:GDSL-type esterase/lipase family protein [Planctomycetota bacterium]
MRKIPKPPPPVAPRLSTRKKTAFSLIAVIAFFGFAELSLHLVGFHHTLTVEAMQFRFPIDDENRSAPEPFLRRDPRLFWRPIPNVLGHNSRGVFGPEFAVPKPKGKFRIVCLGDSCTHFGPRPYPERLAALLEQWKPGRFEVINAGVIGYTSHQGLARLESEVLAWQPDLVTAYFGWNDHWLAHGRTDREQPRDGAPPPRGFDLLARARVVQLIAWGVGRLAPAPPPRPRVELRDYRDNLAKMPTLAKECGTVVWFLTAPDALNEGVPSYLIESHEASDDAAVLALHRRYVEATRAQARESGATLIDLAATFGLRPDKSSLFIDDHIHLSDAGLTLAAETLASEIRRSFP